MWVWRWGEHEEDVQIIVCTVNKEGRVTVKGYLYREWGHGIYKEIVVKGSL